MSIGIYLDDLCLPTSPGLAAAAAIALSAGGARSVETGGEAGRHVYKARPAAAARGGGHMRKARLMRAVDVDDIQVETYGVPPAASSYRRWSVARPRRTRAGRSAPGCCERPGVGLAVSRSHARHGNGVKDPRHRTFDKHSGSRDQASLAELVDCQLIPAPPDQG
jgi:hypothetical protein